MKEFLEVWKDLHIMEITDVPEEKNTPVQENVNENHQDISPEDDSSDDVNSIDEIEKEGSTATNEASLCTSYFNNMSSM